MRKPIGKIKNASLARRVRRKLSIRSKLAGVTSRPRICVSKTNKHLRVQVIDDSVSKTLFSVQTYGKSAVAPATNNKEGGKAIGNKLAEELKSKNITNVVFDRSGYTYTGVIAAIADSMRENGIKL